MPSPTPADQEQRELLEKLKDLAQNESVNITNQLTLIDEQIAMLQAGEVLFTDRYAFWEDFIQAYEAERVELNGQSLIDPVVEQDFTDFLAGAGRLENESAGAPDKFKPKRISQFDGSPLAQGSSYELDALAREATTRNDLQNGFTSAFPLVFRLKTDLSSSDTAMNIEQYVGTGITPPLNERILLVGGGSAAIVVITSILFSLPSEEWIVAIQKETTTFAEIPSTTPLLNSLPAFTDAERILKTAANPSYQPVMNQFVSSYTAAVTYWLAKVEQELDFIDSNVGEDAPDTAYIAALTAIKNQLTSYLPSLDISDVGLAAQEVRYDDRVAAIPTRLTWIANRLITSGAAAYDGRYKYGNYLYNLTDGSTAVIQRLQNQKVQLLEVQALNNQRASQYAAEIF